MSSRLVILACVALAVVAGCRDLVTPEGAMNGGSAPLQVQVIGLGSDALMDGAVVTADNSAYVEDGSARTAEAIVENDFASFPDLPPGRYDIYVDPRSRFSNSTPAWTEHGVLLGDSIPTLASQGIACGFVVDWPLLEEFAPESYTSTVYASYHFPGITNELRGSQAFNDDGNGVYRGVIPWEGSVEVRVILRDGSFAETSDFYLRYELADSVGLLEDEVFSIASPLTTRPLNLQLSGEGFAAGSVRTLQDIPDPESGIGSSPSRLDYTLDRLAHPDRVFLIESALSFLSLEWQEGPAFLNQGVWLANDLLPDPFELGLHRVVVQVVDANQRPQQVLVGVDDESTWTTPAWFTDENGQVDLRLMPGRYRLLVRVGNDIVSTSVITVDGDLEHVIILEEVAE